MKHLKCFNALVCLCLVTIFFTTQLFAENNPKNNKAQSDEVKRLKKVYKDREDIIVLNNGMVIIIEKDQYGRKIGERELVPLNSCGVPKWQECL